MCATHRMSMMMAQAHYRHDPNDKKVSLPKASDNDRVFSNAMGAHWWTRKKETA